MNDDFFFLPKCSLILILSFYTKVVFKTGLMVKFFKIVYKSLKYDVTRYNWALFCVSEVYNVDFSATR